MGTTRGQRSKREATFLENVCATLEVLHSDIIEIKAAVSTLKYDAECPFSWSDLPPPAAPPPLDIYGRDELLEHRPHKSENIAGRPNVSLPRTESLVHCSTKTDPLVHCSTTGTLTETLHGRSVCISPGQSFDTTCHRHGVSAINFNDMIFNLEPEDLDETFTQQYNFSRSLTPGHCEVRDVPTSGILQSITEAQSAAWRLRGQEGNAARRKCSRNAEESLAAVSIQKVYRSYRVKQQIRNATQAAISIQRASRRFLRKCNIYYNTCGTCKKCFGIIESDGSWCGDACDDCGVPTCEICLCEVLDLTGDWRLCQACSDQRRLVRKSFVTDTRTLPKPCWDKLYAKFSSGDVAPQSSNAQPASITSTNSHAIDFKPLDDVLDSVLQFLEGKHAKSQRITPDVRNNVLRLVKAATTWKKKTRTKEELESYIATLNMVMGDIVGNL